MQVLRVGQSQSQRFDEHTCTMLSQIIVAITEGFLELTFMCGDLNVEQIVLLGISLTWTATIFLAYCAHKP